VIVRPPLPVPESWSLGDLERMRIILRGGSVIDWRRLHFQAKEEVDHYLRLCLFEPDDPFDRARLQRILDEAVDYLRTSFRYRVAEEVARPREVQDLFLLASGVREPQRLRRIACLVLKVMHVVHHVEARGLLHRARVSEDELAQLVTARVDHAIAQLRRAGVPELEDYPPVVRPTTRQLRRALSNSLGFGGTNVALVLAHPLDGLQRSGARPDR
jgi:uncharacterized protein (TIGR04552 family)